MQWAKRFLLSRGFQDEQVASKVQTRKLSKVLDIVREGERGMYDAVVFGRRGLSWLEQAFDESVTGELLKTKVGFPIWVCRKPESGRRNVLVCIDGSEAAFRAVDHAGFMLSDQVDQEITLMTVATRRGGDGDALWSACTSRLQANGFPEDRIRFQVAESGNVARTILREAERGRFGALAVGRTGEGKARGLFMGSVSTTLFKELEKASLWICY